MWGFSDLAHWKPHAAICNGESVTPNDAGNAYMNLYHNTFQTHVNVKPELNGDQLVTKFRAFKGDFDVTIVDSDSGEILQKFEKILKVGNEPVEISL